MTDPAPPTFTISEPVLLKSGKFSVVVVVSDVPGYRHCFKGETAKEADSKSREFVHARLRQFYRSLAAKHHRAARRIATAREPAPGAHMKGQTA